MKINLSEIKNIRDFDYNEDLNYLLSEESNFIKNIKSTTGLIKVSKISDVYEIIIDVEVNMDVMSAYTFKIFDDKMKIHEKIYITNVKELESEDVFYEEGYIDLDLLIYSFLITNMPLNPHKKGEKIENGANYEVINENDLEKEDENPFSVLKDLDFE